MVCCPCDGEGNVYVLDYKDVCVKVFDQSGRFLRKMFRKGRGPEEIEVPYQAVINKYSNHLFVLDMHGYELKEFDLSEDEFGGLRIGWNL